MQFLQVEQPHKFVLSDYLAWHTQRNCFSIQFTGTLYNVTSVWQQRTYLVADRSCVSHLCAVLLCTSVLYVWTWCVLRPETNLNSVLSCCFRHGHLQLTQTCCCQVLLGKEIHLLQHSCAKSFQPLWPMKQQCHEIDMPWCWCNVCDYLPGRLIQHPPSWRRGHPSSQLGSWADSLHCQTSMTQCAGCSCWHIVAIWVHAHNSYSTLLCENYVPSLTVLSLLEGMLQRQSNKTSSLALTRSADTQVQCSNLQLKHCTVCWAWISTGMHWMSCCNCRHVSTIISSFQDQGSLATALSPWKWNPWFPLEHFQQVFSIACI